MTVYEADGSIVIVDAGLAFPRDEHLGVDLVLPDFSYLRDREQMVRAVVLTHGHEDHVGSLPVPDARGARPARPGDPAHARARQVEARRARAAALRRAAGADAGRRPRRDRAVPGRVHPHGALDSRRGRGRARDARRPLRPHRRLQARPHAGRRPAHRRRAARRGREPRRRPPARRLHERRAARRHEVGAGRRGGVPPDLPASRRPDPRLLLRLERAPDAAGRGRRGRLRPQGRLRRPLDAQEREHRAQPRLHGRSRGRDPAAAGAGRAATRTSS